MVDIEELCVGDRVKIVDEWNEGCKAIGIVDDMDKFRGKVVMVKDVRIFGNDPDCYSITLEEDYEEWNYNRWMIECRITTDELDSMEEISTDVFSNILLS